MFRLPDGRIALRFSVHPDAAESYGREDAVPNLYVSADEGIDLLALGKDHFLIAYSWFRAKDAQGRERKSILVRRARLER